MRQYRKKKHEVEITLQVIPNERFIYVEYLVIGFFVHMCMGRMSEHKIQVIIVIQCVLFSRVIGNGL